LYFLLENETFLRPVIKALEDKRVNCRRCIAVCPAEGHISARYTGIIALERNGMDTRRRFNSVYDHALGGLNRNLEGINSLGGISKPIARIKEESLNLREPGESAASGLKALRAVQGAP
jgi:NAD-dependent dihydropyrimidine dehydrogenase PreA subunit